MRLLLTVKRASGWGAVILLSAAIFVAAAALASNGTAEAQSHTAVRSFPASWVEPGGILEVLVAAEGYGAIGQVVENLPNGFVYLGSDLPEAAVSAEERTIAFTLFQSSSFTYLVTVPEREGSYSFSGVIKDDDRQERPVAGSSNIMVGSAPTPVPTAEPTPTPTRAPTRPPAAPRPRPTPTRTPTPTPSPTPTPAPTPTPTATPAPTRIPWPTATPTPAPAAVVPTALPTPAARETSTAAPAPAVTGRPTRQPAATPEPTATPTQEPTPLAGALPTPPRSQPLPPPAASSGSADGLPAWAIAAIAAGAASLLVAGGVAAYILYRRRQLELWPWVRW